MMFKETVNRQGVQPCIYWAIGIAEMIYREAGFICVVTSMTDSHENRPNSLHHKGLAVDLRTRHLPAEIRQKVAGSLKAILDPLGFDVVLESDHIHMEYDPKGKETWLTLEAAS